MYKTLGMRWLVVAVSAVMLLVLAAACGETKTIEVPGETIVVEKEVVKTVEVEKVVARPERIVVKEVDVSSERYVRNVWGELVDKPQYGGTIALAQNRAFPENTEPSLDTSGNRPWAYLVFERMIGIDWTLPRDEYPLKSPFMSVDMMTGDVAERWDISPDLLTYTFHFRKGVHWHDKPPLNGRELTAYDAEFTWQRALGLGEFAEEGPNPRYWSLAAAPVESVTATDKYTLVFQMHTPSLTTIQIWFSANDDLAPLILPREVYEEYGDMSDWRHVVGSGPFELTDLVPGSSLTLTKYPNHWKYDPLYPDLELRLPYVDQIKQFLMPDTETQVAALRTGKIAWADPITTTLDTALSLQRTNPELVVTKIPGDQLTTPAFRMERRPFDDKNVRIALQKA